MDYIDEDELLYNTVVTNNIADFDELDEEQQEEKLRNLSDSEFHGITKEYGEALGLKGPNYFRINEPDYPTSYMLRAKNLFELDALNFKNKYARDEAPDTIHAKLSKISFYLEDYIYIDSGKVIYGTIIRLEDLLSEIYFDTFNEFTAEVIPHDLSHTVIDGSLDIKTNADGREEELKILETKIWKMSDTVLHDFLSSIEIPKIIADGFYHNDVSDRTIIVHDIDVLREISIENFAQDLNKTLVRSGFDDVIEQFVQYCNSLFKKYHEEMQ